MFKKGDKVRRTVSGDRNATQGQVYTVDKVSSDGRWISLASGAPSHEPNYLSEMFELVQPKYPNDPHPHAEVIKAWADGADIEYKTEFMDNWRRIRNPQWSKGVEYRIKPEVPEVSKRDQEIQDIQDRMKALQERMDNLKDNQ
jgi:hypothetical protein